MKACGSISDSTRSDIDAIYGSRVAIDSHGDVFASIQMEDGLISKICRESPGAPISDSSKTIDLSGFLLLPGLINAHDHLEFALYPRLADPPYRNYIEWGEDIHSKFPALIAKHRAVTKDVRLWWGGIRNLLCGVTTVCHHNPLWPELQRGEFPIRVVRNYGWGHSFALGGNLSAAHKATPEGAPFILHACEGVDECSRDELRQLDKLELLDANTVLVHGLALNNDGVETLIARKTSLIVCPSSNYFLFSSLPDMAQLSRIAQVALGNDSPLTATGDLLDELGFAIQSCRISRRTAYDMVTTIPASILHLEDFAGTITESGIADFIAIRDTGINAADRIGQLSIDDIEFVMIGGRVHLASPLLLDRLPIAAKQGLEPLTVDGTTRWLRAPIEHLMQAAEAVLGSGEIRLGQRTVSRTVVAGVEYVQ